MIKENVHFAFNIWDFESAKAVMDAASILGQDVILQTSAGIYKKLPAKSFSEFVKQYSSYKGIQVWLNLDHCKEKELLLHAVDHGWDMVMADGSSCPIQENIAFTNEVTSYAHQHGVMVEAEVGQVKGIEDDVVNQQSLIASREEIACFFASTDVDFIAVAFGNAHGEYKVEPELHYDLVEYTTSLTNIPFVVHGGSGLPDAVLSKLIGIKGVKKLNISTEMKTAYKKGLEIALSGWSQPIVASDLIHDQIMYAAMSRMKILK